MNLIAHETNCHIVVKFHASDPNSMIIKVDASSSPSMRKSLDNIPRPITDLLLGYSDLDRDGAKGRLVYEIAVQCRGPHRPNASTSRAVQVPNPFNSHQSEFMTVLELPHDVYKGRKEYHADYLQNSRFLDRIGRDCSVKFCGDAFGTPTRYCAPYVFVSGKRYQDVDWTAEMVKEEIRRHMDKCVCRIR